MTTRRSILLIVIIGVLLWFPSVFGQFVWDDEDFVYENQYVKEFRIDKFITRQAVEGRGKVSNYWRPVQFSIYGATHNYFGFNPYVYHVINIIAHIAAAISIYIFFSLIENRKSKIAFLVVLIFLIHPVQTEAVSYVSGLSDPLYVLFGFISLIGYLRQKDAKWYGISLGAFLLTILSKESGLSFAGLIFLQWLLYNGRKNIVRLIPYGLISVVYLWVHFRYINVLDMHQVWGNNPYSNSLIIRLSTFIQNLVLSAKILVFPSQLFMERDATIHIPSTFFTLQTIVICGVLLLLFISIFFITKKRSNEVANQRKTLLFYYAAFFISLIPTSGLVLINGIYYEHFLYLPIVFFFAFVFTIIWTMVRRFIETSRLAVRISLLFCIFWLLLLAGRNLLRQQDWIDPVRLYTQTLGHAPKSLRIWNNLGMELSTRGEFDLAIKAYTTAISINPQIPNMYHNLGNIYQTQGNIQKAKEYYEHALSVDPSFMFSRYALEKISTPPGALHEK
jgi:protein O-mannosyl-transferase